MTLEQHLAHLLWLMEDYPEAWKAECWRKAKELAKRPELAELTSMLEAAMRERSKPSTPEQPCTALPTSTNGAPTSITSSASK
jgi:hypothetical protein